MVIFRMYRKAGFEAPKVYPTIAGSPADFPIQCPGRVPQT